MSSDDLISLAERRLARSGFAEMLNLDIEALTESSSRISTDSVEGLLNPGGVLHGAATSGLLDIAMGLTVLAELDFAEVHASTAQMNIDFLEMVPADSRVTATGELLRSGERLMFTRGELHRSDGELAATASGIYVPTEWSAD